MLLGTVGLAVVLVRNVLERRAELATLRAFGFRRSALSRLVLVENAFLRVFYRFERATIRDFSQQQLIPEDVLLDSGALFLGHIDRDFDVHIIGITLGLRI